VGTPFARKPEPKPARKERPDGMKLARQYQALLDSGKFENPSALARHLGVSGARVTQLLHQLQPHRETKNEFPPGNDAYPEGVAV
jgi:hypothetical protein